MVARRIRAKFLHAPNHIQPRGTRRRLGREIRQRIEHRRRIGIVTIQIEQAAALATPLPAHRSGLPAGQPAANGICRHAQTRGRTDRECRVLRHPIGYARQHKLRHPTVLFEQDCGRIGILYDGKARPRANWPRGTGVASHGDHHRGDLQLPECGKLRALRGKNRHAARAYTGRKS